jgi:hypothetical protein
VPRLRLDARLAGGSELPLVKVRVLIVYEDAMEDMHIPDYVMLDFGFLEGRGTSGKSLAR